MEKRITNKNEIKAYLYCGKCLKEYKEKGINEQMSPKEYSKTQTGFTKYGLQVWCNRHNCNIMHMDFEGFKHPADITIAKDGEE